MYGPNREAIRHLHRYDFKSGGGLADKTALVDTEDDRQTEEDDEQLYGDRTEQHVGGEFSEGDDAEEELQRGTLGGPQCLDPNHGECRTSRT